MSELLKKTRDEEWTRALSAVARMLVFVSQEEQTPVLSEEEATDLAVFVLEHELSERGLKPPSGEHPVSARPAISRRGVIAEAKLKSHGSPARLLAINCPTTIRKATRRERRKASFARASPKWSTLAAEGNAGPSV